MGQILINGALLREDRTTRRLSREAFIKKIDNDTGIMLSISTLRRAEEGKVSPQNLNVIAQTIGFPPEKYMMNKTIISKWQTPFDLNGQWEVYYLEDDVGTQAYIATEIIFVTHNGSDISGVYEPKESDHPNGYLGSDAFVMEGVVAQNVLMGRYYVDERAYPRGAGVFQLIVLRNGDWAEGFCTFLGDDNLIMVCYNIWIKNSSPQFRIMRKQAREFLNNNKLLYRAPFTTKSGGVEAD